MIVIQNYSSDNFLLKLLVLSHQLLLLGLILATKAFLKFEGKPDGFYFLYAMLENFDRVDRLDEVDEYLIINLLQKEDIHFNSFVKHYLCKFVI